MKKELFEFTINVFHLDDKKYGDHVIESIEFYDELETMRKVIKPDEDDPEIVFVYDLNREQLDYFERKFGKKFDTDNYQYQIVRYATKEELLKFTIEVFHLDEKKYGNHIIESIDFYDDLETMRRVIKPDEDDPEITKGGYDLNREQLDYFEKKFVKKFDTDNYAYQIVRYATKDTGFKGKNDHKYQQSPKAEDIAGIPGLTPVKSKGYVKGGGGGGGQKSKI